MPRGRCVWVDVRRASAKAFIQSAESPLPSTQVKPEPHNRVQDDHSAQPYRLCFSGLGRAAAEIVLPDEEKDD